MEWTIPAVTTIDSKDYMLHATWFYAYFHSPALLAGLLQPMMAYLRIEIHD